MNKVQRTTGFQRANGDWFIGHVKLVIDEGNHAVPIWPKHFHNYCGSDWEVKNMTRNGHKLLYKEIGKSEVVKQTDADRILVLEEQLTTMSKILDVYSDRIKELSIKLNNKNM